VLTESRLAGVPIDFIGDLDPLDLTAFLLLSTSEHHSASVVRYFGIDDRWLALCRRYATGRGSSGATGLPTIEMHEFEKNHLARLIDLPIDWERLVGAEAMALLQSGHKLELEGATNPDFYRSGFSKRVARHLFRLPKAARR
jgi:hypothetical protein